MITLVHAVNIFFRILKLKTCTTLALRVQGDGYTLKVPAKVKQTGEKNSLFN